MKALIADDDPITRLLITEKLQQWGYDILTASNGHEALQLVKDNVDVQLFLLDWQMPGLNGIELCRKLKLESSVQNYYIIILTGLKGAKNVVTALEAGADDFISKPFSSDELKVRLNVGNRILQLQNRLFHQSRHDPLTNVLNHRSLFEYLENLWAKANRDKVSFSVVMIDLDFFKKINDNYGHPVGDDALIHFCEVVKDEVRPYDYIGRYGGEEFILLLPDSGAEQAQTAAQRIQQTLKEKPLLAKGDKIVLTASIGIAEYSENFRSHKEMVLAADQAVYQAKAEGRDRIVVSHS